jgi:8-oxo-dGTP pyrophosphatase MutT (NUDIX family)
MASQNDLQSFIICPNLILMKNIKILLLKRADSSFFPGYWHCVTGKMEQGETPKQTIVREAFEEVGLDIDPDLGTAVSVTAKNFQNPELIWKDISLFFVVKDFESEPVNKEPRLHDKMEWFDVNSLPSPIIPVVEYGIKQYVQGKMYGDFYDL